MNFSGGGISWTLGPKGTSIGIGQRGTYLNTGIPGTGLSTRKRLDTPKSSTRSSNTVIMSAVVSVQDDGTLVFKDSDGSALPEFLVERAKKQNSEAIKQLIQKSCDGINSQIEALGEIYLFTPDCRVPPKFIPRSFDEPYPRKPIPKGFGILGYFFTSVKERILKENLQAQKSYETNVRDWEKLKADHDASELARKKFLEIDIFKNSSDMEVYLEEKLHEIVWPRETTVSLEIEDNGLLVMLDVDLPEIEEMPHRTATFPQRGYKLAVKEMSPTQVQKLYMRHVHAIGFRIVGETFSALPTVQQVVLSAYSQRPNPVNGQVSNEYLYSVRVRRNDWARIQFDRLQSIDVIESLAQFELRRDMTKTGVFRAIDPFLK